jgi:CRISPR-associated protein Cmr2
MILMIGPVQEFIATARRSRDLWFGSWLLSELSKAAAKLITERNSELIFPAVENSNDLKPVEYDSNGRQSSGTDFSVVNKIVALIKEDPSQMGSAIEAAVKARLETIRIEAYKQINEKLIDSDKAQLQVADLPEIYWVASPLNEDLSNYPEAREVAERLLVARRKVRNFTQPLAWSDYFPKSSLDGHRESVIVESTYNNSNKFDLRKQLGVREGERLCGVGLLKRHGNRHGDGSFFSTSHVAALPLLTALTADKREWVEDFERELTSLLGVITERDKRELLGYVPLRAQKISHPVFGRNDGRILFEDRLGEFFDTDKLNAAREALRRFLNKACDGMRPKPYYALLHADGDWMGEAIAAKKTINDHKKISADLSRFAGLVRRIVEHEHGGSLVYSGGDDVLALLPLHEAIFCARKLADTFKATLKTSDTEAKSPTLSVGIAVGHHLDPLHDSLELARQAETAAKKQVEGKNALAIIISKRSGSDWLVQGSWRDGGDDVTALDNRLNYFIYLYLKEALPRGVGHELLDVALHLKGLDHAVRAEALRIIKRKRTKEGKLADVVYRKLDSYINDPDLSIEDLAYQIITARPFADAMSQAGIELETFVRRSGLKEFEALENGK